MGKKVLVAPLNWGLGHASRCIPIIIELIKNNFYPIIASDGAALQLLTKEFPELPAFELPSYNIKYAEKGSFLKWKLLLQSRYIFQNIQKENEAVEKLVEKHSINGIISDNRWGAYHPSIKNVFITHQLKVMSGLTTALTTEFHKKLIRNFDECWIPDFSGNKNLSGILGHEKLNFPPVKYIGPLSRFNKKEAVTYKYNYCVLLSGPEPQRGLLEKILLQELQKSSEKILFIRGILDSKKPIEQSGNITFKNFLLKNDLEKALNESQIIISRSGYTTIMDLAKLGKKAFFIPTPGQKEQLYLANRMKTLGFAPFCYQKKFTLEKLIEVNLFTGFDFSFGSSKLSRFLTFFQGE